MIIIHSNLKCIIWILTKKLNEKVISLSKHGNLKRKKGQMLIMPVNNYSIDERTGEEK